MVTQRITHKIVYGFVQFDSCLGAAGIDVVGIFYQLACGNEILVQTLSRAFYHRDASRMQNTLYGYPGFRFKMIPDDKTDPPFWWQSYSEPSLFRSGHR